MIACQIRAHGFGRERRSIQLKRPTFFPLCQTLLSADIGLATQAHARFGALFIDRDHIFRLFIYSAWKALLNKHSGEGLV